MFPGWRVGSHPLPLWKDTHPWKHYLPTTSFAGGNDQELGFNPVVHCTRNDQKTGVNVVKKICKAITFWLENETRNALDGLLVTIAVLAFYFLFVRKIEKQSSNVFPLKDMGRAAA